MAKLPTRESLGGLPSRPSRQIASIAVPGADPTGLGLEKLGRDLSGIGAKLSEQQDQFEYSNAHADLMKTSVELDTKYLNDTDYTTRPQRYSDDLDNFVKDRAAKISNPQIRDRFLANAGAVHAQHIYKQTTVAQQIGNQDAITKLQGEGEYFINSTSGHADESIRNSAIEGYKARVGALVSSRVLTPIKGAAAIRKFVHDYNWARSNSLIDNSRIDDGTLDALENEVRTAPPLTGGANLKDEIKRFEGFSPKAKWDYKQNSNGYGTRASFTGEAIDKATAETRLDAELQKASDFVDSVNPNLPAGVKKALTSLTYNAGGEWANAGLGQSIRSGDFETAKRQFVQYNKAGGETNEGLVARRNKEVRWFDQPDEQVGVQPPNTFSYMSTLERQQLLVKIEHVRQTQKTKAEAENRKLVAENANAIERQLIDASAGVSPLPGRASIENAVGIDEQHRNTLLRQHAAAAKDIQVFNKTFDKFLLSNGGPFNPHNKDERRAVERIYTTLQGSNPQDNLSALNLVVDRTGEIPDSVALSIRGGLVSTDPRVVQRSLEMSSNLLTRSSNVFIGTQGKDDFESAAVTYRHYVDDLGMTATEATRKYMESQTPEYQAKQAKIKTEDLNDIVKKRVSIDDLRGAFDDSWLGWRANPKVGFAPEPRQEMYNTYVEQFKKFYLENGDISLAKKLAADSLKKTWGVSTVNGSNVVMPYPPEKSPRFANMENASELIADQAIAAVKEETGQDIKRDALQFKIIPAVTAAAYKAGQPTLYQIFWTDKNGVVQSLNPGRVFVPDVEEAHKKRQTEFESKRDQRVTRAQQGDVTAKPLRDLLGSNLARQSEMQANLEATRDKELTLNTSGGL